MNNYYDVLHGDDDDDETVVMSNCLHKHECDNATASTIALTDDELSSDEESTTNETKPTEYAILDSGATAHFIIKGAAVKNEQTTSNPLKIKLPDGTFIHSTHTCNLDIPWLPHEITEAHIVPGLSHSSLVATRKFCDVGCKITFDMDECRIYYKGKLVLSGTRDHNSGLWKVPINPTTTSSTLKHLDLSSSDPKLHSAANLYTLPSKQQQLKYIHQLFFSPPAYTLIKAINNWAA